MCLKKILSAMLSGEKKNGLQVNQRLKTFYFDIPDRNLPCLQNKNISWAL